MNRILSIEQEEFDGQLETYSDANCQVPTELVPDLFMSGLSETAFDESPLTWKKMQGVRKSRAGLAVGLNGVKYAFYNRCPGLLRSLWSFLVNIWEVDDVREYWG